MQAKNQKSWCKNVYKVTRWTKVTGTPKAFFKNLSFLPAVTTNLMTCIPKATNTKVIEKFSQQVFISLRFSMKKEFKTENNLFKQEETETA